MPLFLFLPKLSSELVTSVDFTMKCFHSLSFFPHVAHSCLGHLWTVAHIPQRLSGISFPCPSCLPKLRVQGSGLLSLQEASLLSLFIHVSLRALHMVNFFLHSAAHYTLSFSYPALFQVCIVFPLKDTDTSHNGFQVGHMKPSFPSSPSLLPFYVY